MSEKIKNRLTNYKTHNIDNMHYDDMSSYGITYYKMNFYNSEIKFPLQKYWLFIPKIRILSNYMQSIKIVLSSELEDVVDLEKFIKKLQKRIKKIVRTKTNKKYKMKSCLQTFDHFPTTMSIKVNSKTCIFDNTSKRIPTANVKSDQIVSLYIELTEIWIDDVQFGFNWNILQMKIHADIDFSICLIDNNNAEDDNYVNKISYETSDQFIDIGISNQFDSSIPNAPPMSPPAGIVAQMSYRDKQRLLAQNQIKVIVPKKEEQQKFAPSLQDLLAQLKNLKKVVREPLPMNEIEFDPIEKINTNINSKNDIMVDKLKDDNVIDELKINEKKQFNKQLDDFFGHVIRKRERDLHKYYKNDEELKNSYTEINKKLNN